MSASAHSLFRRAGAAGIELSTFRGLATALSDVEKKLGVRLYRSSDAACASLVGAVEMVDRRIIARAA